MCTRIICKYLVHCAVESRESENYVELTLYKGCASFFYLKEDYVSALSLTEHMRTLFIR